MNLYSARMLVRVLSALLLLAGLGHAQTSASPVAKTARSRLGMVATSNPHATAAGVKILEAGGNAVDAAAAACFALMVTDLPMTSLGGRTQILLVLKDGRVVGIDGATEAPASVPPLANPDEDRGGYQIVPVPGNPAALAEAVGMYGKLTLAQVLEPAIEIAEKGFPVTPNVAAIWQNGREQLAGNAGASAAYLKPDGSAYEEGEVFKNPQVARVLRALAESGPEVFYRGWIAEAIVKDAKKNGGYIRASDLEDYAPQPATVVRTSYRGYEIVTLGRHAWGNTLAEMLNILGHFRLRPGGPTTRDVELFARIIRQALDDRPQLLGSLKPKPGGYALEEISSTEFAAQRAEQIRREMESAGVPPSAPDDSTERGETTHLSAMDAEGNAVALTTSIGPRFGSRVATPELGFLYAHSYRMRSDPTPHERDLTEMTPTIVLRDGRPILAIGAAGSAMIPGAILHVLSYVIDRGYPLEKAMQAPRIAWSGSTLRVHEDWPRAFAERLRARGFTKMDVLPRTINRHLGIVQAVLLDEKSGEFVGAADPVYDGAAAGPMKVPGVAKEETTPR